MMLFGIEFWAALTPFHRVSSQNRGRFHVALAGRQLVMDSMSSRMSIKLYNLRSELLAQAVETVRGDTQVGEYTHLEEKFQAFV